MAWCNHKEELKFSDNSKSSFLNRTSSYSSTYRNNLEKSHTNLPLQRSGSVKDIYNLSFESVKGKVKRLCSIFEPPKPKPSPSLSSKPAKADFSDPLLWLPGTEDRVVIFFTSLRGIRRTYQDCCAVRNIFWCLRVNVDERDVSMDLAFRKELQRVLGEKSVCLPQVFIKGKYIGSSDAVKQLHEVGELAKILKGLPLRAPGYVCEGCGDVRFVPCLNCHGSRKIFDEDEEQLKRCPDCNENGLIRCPNCSS